MQLIVVDSRNGRRKAYALPEGGLRVGSGVDCDVVLPGDGIAAHALELRAGADGVVAEAVGKSRFLLNERPSGAAIVHVGDVVKIGPFQLVVAPEERLAQKPAVAPRAAPAAPARANVGSRESSESGAYADDSDRADAGDDAEDDEDDEDAGDDAGDDPAAERVRAFAKRRSQQRREEAWLGVLFVVVAAGVLAWGARQGWFSKFGKSREPEPPPGVAGAPTGGGDGLRTLTSQPGLNEALGEKPTLPFEVDPDSGEVFDPVDTSWRKQSSAEEVAATLKKVEELLAVEEFARARWLLWRLTPSAAESERVEQRRREVDVATAKGGADHLAFVDELVKKGKIAAALSHCVEESIERFRGTETWYALLEKADEIEAIIDERVPEVRRLTSKVKHARPRPVDLESRPPPPARVTIAEEMREVQKPPRAPSGAGAPERGSREGGREGEVAGGSGKAGSAGGAPRDGEAVTSPAGTNDAEAAPTPELLAAREKVVKALDALAAAKTPAIEARLEDLGRVVDDVGGAAVVPLSERAKAIGAELAAAPEKAALAGLRSKCEAVRAARAEAFLWLDDPARYFMLDPKAPGDVGRGEELQKAQKEADRRVEAVRDVWGSELGSAPAPQVALSEGYSRRVREVRAIDALLESLKAPLPDQTDLLATRLLPRWTNKVHVRNYALDLAERARLDGDREIREVNQRLRDVDGDALELLAALNSYREMFGRPQLRWDMKLATSAQVAAAELAKGVKAYKESDPQPLPDPRTAKDGGVNYLRGRFSARQALQQWGRMADAHRHLLDLDHRALGVGVEPKYWVAKFGKFLPN